MATSGQGILSKIYVYNLGLSHHRAFLFRRRALNPVIKKINFPGSLYTFLKFTLGLARPPDFSFSRIHPICIIYFYIMGTWLYFIHHPSRLPIPPTRHLTNIRNLSLFKFPTIYKFLGLICKNSSYFP